MLCNTLSDLELVVLIVPAMGVSQASSRRLSQVFLVLHLACWLRIDVCSDAFVFHGAPSCDEWLDLGTSGQVVLVTT